MFLPKLPTWRKKPRTCSEKDSDKWSKDSMSNEKEASNETDMRGVTSDLIQDKTM